MCTLCHVDCGYMAWSVGCNLACLLYDAGHQALVMAQREGSQICQNVRKDVR